MKTTRKEWNYANSASSLKQSHYFESLPMRNAIFLVVSAGTKWDWNFVWGSWMRRGKKGWKGTVENITGSFASRHCPLYRRKGGIRKIYFEGVRIARAKGQVRECDKKAVHDFVLPHFSHIRYWITFRNKSELRNWTKNCRHIICIISIPTIRTSFSV